MERPADFPLAFFFEQKNNKGFSVDYSRVEVARLPRFDRNDDII